MVGKVLGSGVVGIAFHLVGDVHNSNPLQNALFEGTLRITS